MKTYKNPPIVEAVCEFRFLPNGDLDIKKIGNFYEKLKSDFPIQEKRKKHFLDFKIEKGKPAKENFKQGFMEFGQFFSEDKKYFIQLDKGRVSIHRIKPYISWSDFSTLIKKVYDAYIENFSPLKITRVGMRYVNEIILPVKDFSFNDYFTITPPFSFLEEEKQKAISIGSVFEQKEERDSIKVQLAEKPSRKPEMYRHFVLDFDYFLVKPIFNFDEIENWLDEAHSTLEDTFDKTLTDNLKESFNKK